MWEREAELKKEVKKKEEKWGDEIIRIHLEFKVLYYLSFRLPFIPLSLFLSHRHTHTHSPLSLSLEMIKLSLTCVGVLITSYLPYPSSATPIIAFLSSLSFSPSTPEYNTYTLYVHTRIWISVDSAVMKVEENMGEKTGTEERLRCRTGEKFGQ